MSRRSVMESLVMFRQTSSCAILELCCSSFDIIDKAQWVVKERYARSRVAMVLILRVRDVFSVMVGRV